VFATKTVTFNGSGIATTDAFYGYPGESVWAEVVGVVTSPRITW
jgi:hypothetical protein